MEGAENSGGCKIEDLSNDVGKIDLNSNENCAEATIITTNGNIGKDGEETTQDAETKKDTAVARKYSYSDNQWSPQNLDGKKCYDIDFLMQFRDDPNALKKPTNIAIPELLTGPHRIPSVDGSRGFSGLMKQNDLLLPGFARGGQRNPLPNRRSQQGKPNGRNNSQTSGNRGVIQVSLSLRSDVKLNETENAWKPSRVRPVNAEQEDIQTQELYKKFRSILNKLTPQNFDKLMAQVREMEINSVERLTGVINLVFEKALDEPHFSVTYALMCKELEQIKVKDPTNDGNEEKYVHFKKLIVCQCQNEFEKANSVNVEKIQEAENCTDPEKKKELLAIIAEEERKIRVRSVGNVRFICELFKQNIMTCRIMVYCIKYLLSKIDEEMLECLCKLLTTIGKNLETVSHVNLQGCFKRLQDIVDNEVGKTVSSRVRFMLIDVIELRKKKWVPRKITLQSNPKTMDQIQNEAELESMSNYGSQSNTPRREDRPSNMNKRGGSKSAIEDGWMNAPSKNSRSRPQPYAVDPGKLSKMIAPPATHISLGPPTCSWSKGAATKDSLTGQNVNSSLSHKNTTESHNSYNALRDAKEDLPQNNHRSGRKYISKGASIERSTFKSEFEHDSNPNKKLTCTLESFGDDVPRKVQALMDQSQNDNPYGILDQIQRNFLNGNVSIILVMKELILWGLQFNKVKNMQIIGEVSGRLVDDQALTLEEFLEAFKQVMDTSIDLFLDGDETIWDILAAFLWGNMLKNPLTLKQIHTAIAKVIDVGMGYEFLLAFLSMKAKEQRSKVNALWENGNMKLTDWFNEKRIEEFTNVLPLECFGHQQITNPEAALNEMLVLINNKTPCDDVDKWIQNRIGESVKSDWFIRALTEAVFTYTLCPKENAKPRFDDEAHQRLNTYNPLLITYIGTKDKFELQCLFAIQHLMIKLEHPSGLTGQLFDHLWDSGEVISTEGFLTWETNNDSAEQEGKGVMLMSLTSFFTALKSFGSSDETASIVDDEL